MPIVFANYAHCFCKLCPLFIKTNQHKKDKNMLITTNREFRLHNPSNAVDEVNLLQGILDNSEKDFLREKLGGPLYDRLCEYYLNTSPDGFYLSVTGGDYQSDPYAILLLYAQRVIVNDALTRYASQQAVSLNGSGVNMASSEDYSVASEKMLDKAIQGYKKEAFTSLNALLVQLEEWAKEMDALALTPSTEDPQDETDTAETDTKQETIKEIVTLWQQSKYYYLHANLLIPTCTVLQRYLDIYENRDKFIRLLPDLLFIQEEYIEEAIGEDLIQELLRADDADRLLKKVRRLIVAYLEERTTVLSIDKTRRQQAHSEAVSLKASVLAIIDERKKAEQAEEETADTTAASTTAADASEGYKNNQPGTRIFVSPMLY